ncbi:MAG: ABC transporter permease [Treponema sp.]|jgi:putative ABC transport system permease protein|nr:ABC transporter permease [Treponema sp.]
MSSKQRKRGGAGTLLKIAYRNIWRNGRRTAFCVIAVGVAVFILVFYRSFLDGFSRSIDDVVQIFETGHVRAVSKDYEAESEYSPVQYPLAAGRAEGRAEGRDLDGVMAEIAAIPGVAQVFPRISSYASLQESVIKSATLWGIDLEAERAAHYLNLTDRDDGLQEGRWPKPGANECAVGYAFARKAGLRLGDRILLSTVSAEYSDKLWEPEIVGIYSFDYIKYDEQTIIVDFQRLARLLDLEGTQQLIIYGEDGAESPRIARAVQGILGEEAVVTGWQETYMVAVMRMMTPLYLVVGLVFLIVASFLIINTVMMIIHERIKEIGMMGSLGMTRAEIVRVFFFESAMLSILGALAGVALGALMTGIGQFYPLRLLDMTGNTFAEFPMGNALFMVFSWTGLVQAFVMGVVVSALFTLIPSLRSAYVEPVEALRR